MAAAWYAILALMLTAWVVLDGFDFGAGMLQLVVARDDAERRTVLAAIGPVWDGNEVWLVASGGILVFAFPRAYAAAFSGFYLPLMLVLWLLIGRGLSIELRGQLPHPLWRSFWDAMFAVSSTLLALVLGASLGNVLRGVPLGSDGVFAAPLFTDFGTRGRTGALDWYTLAVGGFAVAALFGHGATYLAWKCDGPVGERAARLAARALPATLFGMLSTTAATAMVQPRFFAPLATRPWAWPLPLVAVAAEVAAWRWSRAARGDGPHQPRSDGPHQPRSDGPHDATGAHGDTPRQMRERRAFLASCVFLASLLLATAAALYPVLLRSTVDAAFDLTAPAAASGRHGLATGLGWWLPSLALAVAYFVYLFRRLRGKVAPDHY